MIKNPHIVFMYKTKAAMELYCDIYNGKSTKRTLDQQEEIINELMDILKACDLWDRFYKENRWTYSWYVKYYYDNKREVVA